MMNNTKKTAKVSKSKKTPLLEKIEELENQLLEVQKKLEDAEKAKLRALADLQNFQRRQSEEKAQWHTSSVVSFVKPFLPRFLELQIGIDHSKDKDAQKVVAKFFEGLQSQGLEKIVPKKGDKIDPHFHEVLMQAEGKPGTVVEVLEPGWKFGDSVIAPAKVSGAAS